MLFKLASEELEISIEAFVGEGFVGDPNGDPTGGMTLRFIVWSLPR